MALNFDDIRPAKAQEKKVGVTCYMEEQTKLLLKNNAKLLGFKSLTTYISAILEKVVSQIQTQKEN